MAAASRFAVELRVSDVGPMLPAARHFFWHCWEAPILGRLAAIRRRGCGRMRTRFGGYGFQMPSLRAYTSNWLHAHLLQMHVHRCEANYIALNPKISFPCVALNIIHVETYFCTTRSLRKKSMSVVPLEVHVKWVFTLD
jgi:hypothetical protein